MNINLKNKVVVITGASRGIGREMALRYSSEGASVVINYYKSYDKTLQLYEKITSFNPKCIMVKADITNPEQTINLYKQTIKNFGRVDILINNAGICNDNLIQIMTKKQWDDVINTNLNGTFVCSKVFSRNMIKNKEGKIINIASLKGQIGCEGQVNYCASKAGIIGLTKALAKELARYNISVNAVCPGFIKTDLNRMDSKKIEQAKRMSLLDLDMNLDNLINFIIYMSSDNFNSITGQIFNIDSRVC